MPSCQLGALLGVVVAIAACDDAGTPVRPPPPAPSEPVLIEQRGPVAIDFLTATPAAGSTVRGCGATVSGCAGRVEMQFVLRAQNPGHVLGVRAFLHAASNLRACLLAEIGPFDLARSEVRPLSIVYDQFDDCGVPLTIGTMAVVVEGTVEVASRRAWQVTYTFER